MKDFDALWKEHQDEGIKFKVFGKEETIPSSIPAYLVFEIMQATGKKRNQEIEGKLLKDICFSIFGEKKVKEWFTKGLTMDQLNDLFWWAVQQYSPKEKTKEEAT